MGKDDDRKPPKEEAGESEMEGLRETSKQRPLREGDGRTLYQEDIVPLKRVPGEQAPESSDDNEEE